MPDHTIVATVVNGPQLDASQIKLLEPTAQDMIDVPAQRVRSYAEGAEPIAVAFVVSGAEYWLGNEQFETDDAARMFGALHGVESAIDAMQLAKLTPGSSEATIITYSTGAQIRTPMGPIRNLAGASLGSQHDYRAQIGDDLVSGITLGMHELERSHSMRRALIVIGDGNDTNNEVAKTQLVELKHEARAQGIEMFSIIYKGELSDPANVITSMIPGSVTVNSMDGMMAQTVTIAQRLTNRYYVTFDGSDLQWDGRPHDLMIRLGGADLDPATVTLPGSPAGKPWWRWFATQWFAQLGVGLLLVGGLVAIRRLTDGRSRSSTT